MSVLVAIRFVEIGGVLTLLLLWAGLAALFVLIVRRSKHYRDHGDPRGL